MTNSDQIYHNICEAAATGCGIQHFLLNLELEALSSRKIGPQNPIHHSFSVVPGYHVERVSSFWHRFTTVLVCVARATKVGQGG